MQTPGASFEKSPNSQCVINIIPPRTDSSIPSSMLMSESSLTRLLGETWAQLQGIRTQFIPDARCGPHLSFIDPFVLPQHYPEAAKLLREALVDFLPFEIRFAKFGHFVHPKSATLFLEPEYDPPDALDELMKRLTKLFPQCDDTVRRGNGKFIAHLSLAKCRNETQVKMLQEKLEAIYRPVSFQLKEIYLLHRDGTSPFQVMEVVHFGPEGTHSPPHFGIGSPGDLHTDQQDGALGRTLVVCGLPKDCTTNEQLAAFFTKNPRKAEIILNPNGKARNVGVVEFATRSECDEEEVRWPADGRDGIYVRRLWMMVFPDVIGGSCSLHSVDKV